MSDVYRLVYYSRNRIAGASADVAASIRSILQASRLNNPRVNVTGALMFNAGCFAQVLEGEREAVAHTFERIQQDERHGDVSLLSFAPAAGRAFPSWSMAFVGGAMDDAARYGTIAAESGFDPSRMSADAVFDTLRRLLIEEEATAV